MSDPNFVIFYVANPLKSAAFYEKILGKPPVEAAPSFVMFALHSGLKLGLWSRSTVEPKVTAPCGGSEIAFPAETGTDVDRRHADWSARGIAILQAPTELDFGRSFVALDPDGNRLRVFAPSEETQEIRRRIEGRSP
jgi:catechol 2,3-dioxygenase-like lactoylglutathione lyase family enzyme